MRSLMIALSLVGTLVTVGTASAEPCAPYAPGVTYDPYEYDRPTVVVQPRAYVPPPPVAPIVYGRLPYERPMYFPHRGWRARRYHPYHW